ncbi:hypothetical protein BGX34_003342 [Mortierella sp. NVP85]|nr:hypothetical protein BGX34_003342 [Mortierella sp. NVP85]
MLGYASISTIWGPISNGRILIYEINELLDALDDVETVVAKYLTIDKVVIKGAVFESFENSIEVFVRRNQSKRRDDANDHHVPRIVSDSINIYRTVDRPLEQWPNPHDSGREYKYRKRYSFKTRSRVVDHPSPERMKRYKWKAWNKNPESPINTDEKPAKPKAQCSNERDVAVMKKKDLVIGMEWEHQLRTLSVGTLNANIKQNIDPTSGSTFISDKAHLSEAIAQYIERVVDIEMDPKDSELLDMICPRISGKSKDREPDELEEPDHQIEERKDRQYSFISSLMHCIYNRSPPSRVRPTEMDMKVNEFLTRAKDFLPAMTGGAVPYYTSKKCVAV